MEDIDSPTLERVGRTWPSALRDVVLIVVSILIAFALDAWWDSRSRDGDQREALTALAEELHASSVELDSVISYNLRQRQAAAYFASLRGRDLSGLPIDSLVFAFAARRGGMTFDPSLGGARSIVASGLVRSPELRAQIAAWPGVLREIEADQDFILQRYEKVSDALAEGRLVIDIDRFLQGLEEDAPPEDETEFRDLVGRMVSNPRVGERIAALGGSIGGLLYELDDVEVRLKALQAAVEGELRR